LVLQHGTITDNDQQADFPSSAKRVPRDSFARR
jgi:hypothetical protein